MDIYAKQGHEQGHAKSAVQLESYD